MSVQQEQVVEQLRTALGQGCIPERHRALGTQLLDQLSDAVRIVVLGRPASGKSSLINMMLGEDLLGPMPGLDIAEVAYGATPKAYLEWPDGRTRAVPGLMVEPHVSEGAFRVRFELPEKALLTQSYCEVNQPGDPERQAQLFRYAVETGQVFVWCSPQFDDTEQAIWRGAPDAIKDHSILALTMADRQLMRGCLTQRIEELDAVVAEEFLGLHPIATLHALAARSGSAAQPGLWETSGAHDLVGVIDAQVRLGRAEELDKAAMLLAQFGGDRGGGEEHRAKPESPGFVAEARGSAQERFQDRMSAAADAMLSELDRGETPNPGDVVGQCVRAVRDLATMLESVPDEEIAARLLEDVREGEEMLMLLQVEQGATAAEDAVVLMMQLRKEAIARAEP